MVQSTGNKRSKNEGATSLLMTIQFVTSINLKVIRILKHFLYFFLVSEVKVSQNFLNYI